MIRLITQLHWIQVQSIDFYTCFETGLNVDWLHDYVKYNVSVKHLHVIWLHRKPNDKGRNSWLVALLRYAAEIPYVMRLFTHCVMVEQSRLSAVCYSYITSMSRISLLLHETQGRVLITMISYKCLWYNWLISLNHKKIIKYFYLITYPYFILILILILIQSIFIL